jgi:hypothetical protein
MSDIIRRHVVIGAGRGPSIKARSTLAYSLFLSEYSLFCRRKFPVPESSDSSSRPEEWAYCALEALSSEPSLAKFPVNSLLAGNLPWENGSMATAPTATGLHRVFRNLALRAQTTLGRPVVTASHC